MSFFRDEFDKLLLAGVLLVFFVVGVHCHTGSVAQFAQDQVKDFTGALLILLTGQKLKTAVGPHGDGNEKNG